MESSCIHVFTCREGVEFLHFSRFLLRAVERSTLPPRRNDAPGAGEGSVWASTPSIRVYFYSKRVSGIDHKQRSSSLSSPSFLCVQCEGLGLRLEPTKVYSGGLNPLIGGRRRKGGQLLSVWFLIVLSQDVHHCRGGDKPYRIHVRLKKGVMGSCVVTMGPYHFGEAP